MRNTKANTRRNHALTIQWEKLMVQYLKRIKEVYSLKSQIPFMQIMGLRFISIVLINHEFEL